MLVTTRLIINCLILLILTYVGLSENYTKCINGEQGDGSSQPIICDPPDDLNKTVDCPFMIIVEPYDYDPINCLKIVNQGNESVDGTPVIAVGGVGYTYVFGDVYSKPGQGVNYTVSVWAKRKPATTTTLATTIETQ